MARKCQNEPISPSGTQSGERANIDGKRDICYSKSNIFSWFGGCLHEEYTRAYRSYGNRPRAFHVRFKPRNHGKGNPLMKNKWKTILAVSASMLLTAPALAGCDLEDGLHNLESSVSVIDGKVADLIEELEALQKEVKALKEEYAKKIEDLNAKHQEDVSAFTASINDLKANLSALRSEYDATIASLKTKNEEFAASLESLRSEYEAKAAALEEEDAANEAALAALRQEYEAKVAELERELLEDQEQIDLIRNTLASLEAQYEQKMAELDAEDAEIEASLSALHAEYNNKVSEIEAAIAANKASIESLKEEYGLKVAEIESSLSSLNADLASLEAQYKADLEALKEEYEGKLAALQSGYDAEIAAINAELDSLGATDQAILERLAALEEKVAELSEIKTYTVTFDPDNGDATFTQLVTERTLLAKPEVDPVKEGHTFLGWFDPSGDKWLFSQSDVKCDMTLKAGYSGNTYTITLDPNGGSVSQTTNLVQYGKPYSLEDATREGFDFAGWAYHDAPVTNYASYDIAADVTYVAKWSRTFQITFDSDGGSTVDPVDNYGSVIGELPAPTKEGFRFAGWYLGSTKIEPGYIHESQENLTLKASWINAASLFEYQSIDGSLTIVRYVGSFADVEIPSSINGVPVTALGPKIFGDRQDIVSVSIPASVKNAQGAFEGCLSIEKLVVSSQTWEFDFTMETLFNARDWSEILESLTTIEFLPGFTDFPEEFFPNNKKSYRFILPEGMLALPSFENNEMVSGIEIPKGITNIDPYTFKSCSFLKYVVFPNSIKTIGEHAFEGCYELSSVEIPDSVSFIDQYAFYGCSSLSSVFLSERITTIGDSAFMSCDKLLSVLIPDSLTTLGADAFSCCSRLSSLTIGKKVSSIGWNTFGGCSSLSDIRFTGTIAQWNDIEKESGWNDSLPAKEVACFDGSVSLSYHQ